MSAPYSNHSDSNYPEDGVTHYPHAKRAKSRGPLHNVGERLIKKAGKLTQMVHHFEGKGAKDKALRRRSEKLEKRK